MGRKSAEQMFDELKTLGLQQEEFPEDVSDVDFWEMYKSTTDDKALKELIDQKKQRDVIQKITLADLVKASFEVAKDSIDQMTIAQRIDVLEDLQKYREYMYECANQYGMEGVSKEDQITAAEFRSIIGRIKHLEILQNWLYGII